MVVRLLSKNGMMPLDFSFFFMLGNWNLPQEVLTSTIKTHLNAIQIWEKIEIGSTLAPRIVFDRAE